MAKPLTTLSRESLYDCYSAITHVVRTGVAGDIVEVGTWAGGGCIAAGLAIANSHKSGCTSGSPRTIYGFDTFEGHPAPRHGEVDIWGNPPISGGAEK